MCMPWLNCKICSKEFYAKPRHIKIGWGKHCSNQCKFKSQKVGKLVRCAICNKTIYKTPKELKRSKSKKYFCNKSCFAVWKNKNILFGKNHPRWKDGANAYRAVMARSRIKPVCNVCRKNDERVLVVHHIDKNRQNNSIKNLTWLCRNCHHLVHGHNQELNIKPA